VTAGSWPERWLDELLWGWDGTWFGFGLPGREPELAEALLAPPYADRGDALRTLARIPALSDATLAAAGACLGDEDASVRAAATSLLGRHRGAAAAQLITRRLMDPDPAVRSAALQALAPDHAESTGCYRAALADPSPDVVHAALRMLADNGHLDEGDLVPLLSAGSPAVHPEAAAGAGQLSRPRPADTDRQDPRLPGQAAFDALVQYPQ
jgi:HEAT repeat protein